MHISQYFSTFVPKICEIVMKKAKLILIFCALCTSVVLLAQEQKNTLPDLYTAEQSFFDPTIKTQVKEEYHFSTPWRLEVGYSQLLQKSLDTASVYMHGLRLGATVDFVLPYRFSIQTGALFTFTYGIRKQHWASHNEEEAQINTMNHNLLQLQLTIPVRAYYNISLWKKLNMFFYAGPQLNIGLTNYDVINAKVSESTLNWLESQGLPTTSHDRYLSKELYRTNIQFGLGGGFEWDRYRLQAGYDFGLNNILRTPIIPSQKMNEWGWKATFCYKL